MSEVVIPFPRRDVVIAFPRTGTKLLARDQALLERLEQLHLTIDRLVEQLGERGTDDLFGLAIAASQRCSQIATSVMEGS